MGLNVSNVASDSSTGAPGIGRQPPMTNGGFLATQRDANGASARDDECVSTLVHAAPGAIEALLADHDRAGSPCLAPRVLPWGPAPNARLRISDS